MDSASIRSKLHQYIDIADDRKLQAINTILEEDIEKKYQYSASEINLLYERRCNHLNGRSKSYTIEESLKQARNKSK